MGVYAVPTGAMRSSATGLAGSEAIVVGAEGLARSGAAMIGDDLTPLSIDLSSWVTGKGEGTTTLAAGAR